MASGGRRSQGAMIVIYGAARGAGASMLVAGLRRAFARRGLRTRGVDPKPSAAHNADTSAAEIRADVSRLFATADLVIADGGALLDLDGGAADVVDGPALLVAEMTRGGGAAQVVGAKALAPGSVAARIGGVVLTHRDGATTDTAAHLRAIEEHTPWPGLGAIPRLEVAEQLRFPGPAGRPAVFVRRSAVATVVTLELPHADAGDALAPLRDDPTIRFQALKSGQALPSAADLVIAPPSTDVGADLAALRAEGWDIDLAAHVRRGGHVLGIGGGFQMLGREIVDPGRDDPLHGLGLLDVTTTLGAERPALHVTGRVIGHGAASGADVAGVELPVGQIRGRDRDRAWLIVSPGGVRDARLDGAASPDGRVRGVSIQGVFESDSFRRAYLAEIMAGDEDDTADAALDALAAHLEAHVDLDAVLRIAERAPDLLRRS